ncbi:MAG TPA: Hsp70 family protein, partial [Gemmataceae bacterium]|nr:Hsp70 family protein [Gemmataceae bacterium]
MAPSRFVVGIDLGTTNSALAYIDTGRGEAEDALPEQLFVPQVVQPGAVEDRPLMPSFLYLPGPNELPAG